jgi:hypothetical protein
MVEGYERVEVKRKLSAASIQTRQENH